MTVRKQILAALVATLALPLAAAAATPDSTYAYLPLSAQQSIAKAESTASVSDEAGAAVSYPLLSYSAGASQGQAVENQGTQASATDDAGKATSYALSSYAGLHDRG